MQTENTALQPGHHAKHAPALTVDWSTEGLYVNRLRLLGDPGYSSLDISYCDGTLDGKPVKVELPFRELPKKNPQQAILRYVFEADIKLPDGILVNMSTLC